MSGLSGHVSPNSTADSVRSHTLFLLLIPGLTGNPERRFQVILPYVIPAKAGIHRFERKMFYPQIIQITQIIMILFLIC